MQKIRSVYFTVALKMRTLIVLILFFIGVNARFEKLREVCRQSSLDNQVGVCVLSEFCCTAVGGTIIVPGEDAPQRRGFSIPKFGRGGAISANMLLARTGADAAVGPGCSYSGVCCMLPTLESHDCSECGLKGNGDLSKGKTPNPTTQATTTPTPAVKKISPRIVQGAEVQPDEYCWQVAILNRTGLIGGGALISRNWMVTACHNIAGLFIDEFIIAMNLFSFVHEDVNGAPPLVYYSQALQVKVHPGFNPANFDNNICMIRIPDAPCSNPGVCTICLPDEPITFEPVTTTTTPSPTPTETTTTTTTSTYAYGSPEAGLPSFDPKLVFGSIQDTFLDAGITDINGVEIGGSAGLSGLSSRNPYSDVVCVVTGWGSNGATGISPTLQKAHHMIIPPEQCEAEFRRLNVPADLIVRPADDSFCTKAPTGGAGTCIGDGGGPLSCQDPITHAWVLRGIIQLGLNMCMRSGSNNGPTIHVNVYNYMDFISETLVESQQNVPAAGIPDRKQYKVSECGSNFSIEPARPCPDAFQIW